MEIPGLPCRVADPGPQGGWCGAGEGILSKQRQAQAILRDSALSPLYDEVRAVYDSFMNEVRLKDVLSLYQQFSEKLSIRICSDGEMMGQCAGLDGDVIFEGAHGTLLDRDHGYYPYVAKTDTTTHEAMRILDPSRLDFKPFTLGVVRAPGYRHGPGPFVTEDSRLSGLFEEKHNKGNAWQGQVRYGWFDLLAIRHGIRLNRHVDALALTMLDHLDQMDPFQVCLSYEYLGHAHQSLEEYFEFTTMASGRTKITGIRPACTHRTDALSRLLFDCVPWDWLCFEGKSNPQDRFIDFLESTDGLGVPVQIISSGPLVADKKERQAAGIRWDNR